MSTKALTLIILYSPVSGKLKILYWNRKLFSLSEYSSTKVVWEPGYITLSSVTNGSSSWIIAYKNANEIHIYDENFKLVNVTLPPAIQVWPIPEGTLYILLCQHKAMNINFCCQAQTLELCMHANLIAIT